MRVAADAVAPDADVAVAGWARKRERHTLQRDRRRHDHLERSSRVLRPNAECVGPFRVALTRPRQVRVPSRRHILRARHRPVNDRFAVPFESVLQVLHVAAAEERAERHLKVFVHERVDQRIEERVGISEHIREFAFAFAFCLFA